MITKTMMTSFKGSDHRDGDDDKLKRCIRRNEDHHRCGSCHPSSSGEGQRFFCGVNISIYVNVYMTYSDGSNMFQFLFFGV